MSSTTATTPVAPVANPPTNAAPAAEGTTAPAASGPAPAPAAASGTGGQFQSASLYVGDLNGEVTEGILFDLFNRVGPVASIRVCRDAVTRRSLGYAYVNFHDVQDAERALDTMQFTDIKGRGCRIMWSQRDPSLRKSGVGNIFVKNLAMSVDNKHLFDIFSMFGNILSCKVAVGDDGESKGYGYVHFETAEAAKEAVGKLNGAVIDECEVSVTPFVRVQDRAGQPEWTNLYVKQFPVTLEDAQLEGLFSPFGTVASVFIKKDAEGKSSGFGFVNFNDHESAEKAVTELNNKTVENPAEPGTTFELYVSKGQKKAERSREIKSKVDAMQQEKLAKFNGMNLFVKNLDDTITEDILRETFDKFGTITSAKIVRDNEQPNAPSKGFGYVCFSSPEEATRAVGELNGKILRSKPITVTLHQSKEQRRAHLAATYAPRNMRYPQGAMGGQPGMYPSMGYMVNGQQGGRGQGGPQMGGFGQPGFNQGFGQPPRGGQMGGRGGQQGGPGGYGQQGFPMPGAPYGMQQVGAPNQGGRGGQGRFMGPGGSGVPMGGPQGQRRPMGPGGPQGGPGGRGQGGMGGMGGPQGQRPMQGQGMPQQGGPGGRGGVRYTSQVRNQGQPGGMPMMMPQMGAPQQPMANQTPMPAQDSPLNSDLLAQAPPADQKNMIGEKLYPLIYQTQNKLAGKITGMLLEMDNAELLNLIESPDALSSKIDEALNVLKKHETGAQGSE